MNWSKISILPWRSGVFKVRWRLYQGDFYCVFAFFNANTGKWRTANEQQVEFASDAEWTGIL